MHVIKEQLGQQMLGTVGLLDAQVFHVLLQGGSFWVGLRVAGTVDRETGLLPFNKGGQVAGVLEVRAFGSGRGAVAAQGQHIAHTGLLQLVQDAGGTGLVIAHADQVGQGGHADLVLDIIGHFYGGNAAGGTACAKGDADKIRVQGAHGLQGGFHLVHLGGLLRREALDGKDAALVLEFFRDRHGRLLYIVHLRRRHPACRQMPR